VATKKIPLLDLMFFLTETAENPKHVGAVQIFQMPANAPKTYMRDLVGALKDAPVTTPFNFRPNFPRVGMPEWLVDDDLDIDYHVRHSALPQPGAHEQLLEVLQRLHINLLDRDRPGWICQVIEGLEGGRFAIYTKIHHAYIDGMSGVKRIYGSLSASPKEMKVTPSWSYVSEHKHGSAARNGKSGGAVLAQARAVTELSSSLARMSLEFLNLRENKAQSLFHAPRTRMNNRIEFNTRSVATCTLPLDRAREVGAKLGGKVNDVILTVIDAALHDYLEAHSENTDTALVALCPMSLRDEGDETATTQATVLHVRLGSPDAKPRDRLQQIIESSSVTKQQARSMSTEALMDFSLALFSVFELVDRSGLKRLFAPSYNVLISNVPGPSEDTLYIRGSKQLASYPISAFLPGGNLNVTILSHGNKLDFGMIADKHALPDLQFVANSMVKQYTKLETDVLGKKGAVSRTKRVGKVGPARKRASPKAKTRRL
jgi:WS/DGAT/MGAT family acyltransferase